MKSEWKIRTVGELTSYISKGIPPKYTDKKTNSTIVVLNQKCNRDYKISYEQSRLHDTTKKAVPTDKMLQYGDVLINSTGTGTAGRIAQFFNNDISTTVDGHMIIMRASKEIDYLYYGYALKSYQKKIESFAEGSTGQTEINKQRLQEELLIKYPQNIDLQRSIALILKNIDDKIELNTAINENLHQLIAAYYAEIFGNCEFSATISDYADKVFSGGTPTTSNESYWNGEFKWLSSGETSQKYIVDTEKTITQQGVENSSTRLASKYDTVIASAGQGHTRGQTSMLLTDTYVNQSIIVVNSDNVLKPFIYWNLCGRYEELRVISNSNSIRGSLTTKMISSFSAPKADLTLINKFSELAWAAILEIEKNCNEITRLTALRDTLLPKLMNGEIDVSAVKI